MLWPFRRTRSKSASATPPAVPAETIVYAIGDIHGRLDLLMRLQETIAAEASAQPRSTKKILIYLGDLIDRGSESAQVVEHLATRPLPGFQSVHLLGNHEATLLDFLADSRVGGEWLEFGGAATLLSYRVRPPIGKTSEGLEQARTELRKRLPHHHREFFEAMVLHFTAGDYFFVHAGVRPGVPLDSQNRDDLLWIREPFLSHDAPFERIVVHGHSISFRPEVCRNRINIDTGAYATNTLTALALEGSTRRFIQAS